MKNFGIAAGVAALLAVGTAHAAPINAIYDTITGGQTGADSGSRTLVNIASGGPLSNSFSVTGPTQLSSVTVRVFDAANTDGGSILVYLVPTDPTRNAPSVTPSGSLTSQVLQGETLLGTILDSSMPTSLAGPCSLLAACNSTINTNAFIGTAGMYWITLVNSSTVGGLVSNAVWEFDGINGGGVGTSGQFANHANATGGLTGGLALTQNPAFELTIMAEQAITTPEPASLAILGAGLAGLLAGCIRRLRCGPCSPV